MDCVFFLGLKAEAEAELACDNAWGSNSKVYGIAMPPRASKRREDCCEGAKAAKATSLSCAFVLVI